MFLLWLASGNGTLRLSPLVYPCRSYSLCDPFFYCSAIAYTSLEPPDKLDRVYPVLLYIPLNRQLLSFHADPYRPKGHDLGPLG